jgi:alpha-ketoglutarate-dependent taurine dioxygenase
MPGIGSLEDKLSHYDRSPAESVVVLRDPRNLTPTEKRELILALRKFNFVIYQCGAAQLDRSGVKVLGAQLGVTRADRNHCADGNDISSIEACREGDRPRYIPYTSRPLGWHTDGYYYGSRSGRAIRSFILHCVSPALEGGENSLLDPDVVYVLLSHIDRTLPAILSRPSVFSIPPDDWQPADQQNDRIGPVFSFDTVTNALHMRYTARRHNIHWNSDPDLRDAARCLKDVIDQAAQYTVTLRLEPGQGVICNNVLHRRSAFIDGPADGRRRLMYRARYRDRIPGTRPGR